MMCGGCPSCRIAFLKNAFAAAISRVLLSLKSMVLPGFVHRSGLVTEIPTHTQNDDFAIEVPPCKQLLDAPYYPNQVLSSLNTPLYPTEGSVCTRAECLSERCCP